MSPIGGNAAYINQVASWANTAYVTSVKTSLKRTPATTASQTGDAFQCLVTVRMPEELLDDLERLRPLLQQLPEYRGETLTRSMLVRLAVAHGLERLRTVLKERVDDELQVDLLEPKQHTLLGDE